MSPKNTKSRTKLSRLQMMMRTVLLPLMRTCGKMLEMTCLFRRTNNSLYLFLILNCNSIYMLKPSKYDFYDGQCILQYSL